jgi:hypothetical protein
LVFIKENTVRESISAQIVNAATSGSSTLDTIKDTIKNTVKDAFESKLNDWLKNVMSLNASGVKMDQASEDIVYVAFVGQRHHFEVH